ncbi:MAG: serine/threonine-protein kinase [Polyangiaceae bacterium]
MERIGEYLVRGLVGEGGMGKVYEAEERLSKRRVALKVLRPELSRSEDGRRLFLNEMTILAHLDHPNIVRCLACTESDDQLVMALEYLEGRTLRTVLADGGPLSWEDAVGIAVQITSALAAAHRQEPPIVHRDLKPENVMVLDDGTVKVMDFGIAKVLEALSGNTTHSVGTLQYMSPEQIDATGVDARSDLYCLGLVMYEMLAGKPPFESASPRELLNMQCTQAPPQLPEDVRGSLPRAVERLVFELLEKSAEDRPASARDVLHELEPFAPSLTRAPRSRATPSPREASTTTPSDTQPSAPHPSADEKSGPPKKAKRPERAVPRADTLALVEKRTADKEVSPRTGVMVILALTVLAALVTYFVRGSDAGVGGAEAPSASAVRSGGER